MNNNNIHHHSFSADIAEVFNIVTANVYQNHEVFLRELLSNASDACEKIFIEAGRDSTKTGIINRSDLKIKIILDKKTKSLVISDNGIGMNQDDLINNLGTIASSGTKKFFKEKLNCNKSQSNLIGQFGIGFYSSFLVAEKVVLRTKKFDSDSVFSWVSQGISGFDIYEVDQSNEAKWLYDDETKNHGTEIILSLKENDLQYLEKYRIKNLVETYSKNISFDIVLNEILDKTSENNDSNEKNNEPICEVLNEEKAVWLKDKKEISNEEYKKFFSKLAGVWSDEPWHIMHSRVEGSLEYTYLFFIPKMTPFNFSDPDRKTSIKLHVNKIFVTEDSPIIPKYLRFLKGIVDSYDLPLNVSRETVQNSSLIHSMNKQLTNKVLGELNYLMNNDEKKNEYKKIFWPNFGSILKEGLCEPLNTELREKILDICLFSSSQRVDTLVSLNEYIDSMHSNQKEIFYFTGSSIDEMMKDPQLEGFIEKGVEVLLLTDGVDDFWLSVVFEYKDKKFKSISMTDINLDEIICEKKENEDEKNKNNESTEDEKKVIEFFKSILKDAVKDVVISKRLSSSPACLGISEGGMNMKMERFLIDQKQLQSKSTKIFEINKNHALIAKIFDKVNRADESEMSSLKEEFNEKIWNLFDFTSIIQGEELFNSKEFSRRASKILEEII